MFTMNIGGGGVLLFYMKWSEQLSLGTLELEPEESEGTTKPYVYLEDSKNEVLKMRVYLL